MANVLARFDGLLRKWNRAGWLLAAASVLSALGFLGLGESAWADWLGSLAAPGSLVVILLMQLVPQSSIFLLFGICFAINVAFWYALLSGSIKLSRYLRSRRNASR